MVSQGIKAMHGQPRLCREVQSPSLHACWLWEPLSHCPRVASAPAVGPEGKTSQEGEGCKAPFGAQSSAFLHCLLLLCQDGEPVTR